MDKRIINNGMLKYFFSFHRTPNHQKERPPFFKIDTLTSFMHLAKRYVPVDIYR